MVLLFFVAHAGSLFHQHVDLMRGAMGIPDLSARRGPFLVVLGFAGHTIPKS